MRAIYKNKTKSNIEQTFWLFISLKTLLCFCFSYTHRVKPHRKATSQNFAPIKYALLKSCFLKTKPPSEKLCPGYSKALLWSSSQCFCCTYGCQCAFVRKCWLLCCLNAKLRIYSKNAKLMPTMSPTSRHRCDMFSELCWPSAKMRRRVPPLVTRSGVMPRV